LRRFSPVPQPLELGPIFDDQGGGSSIVLFQGQAIECPPVVSELSALNVNMGSMSFHVPSFPCSHECLIVDSDTVVGSSDVSVESQRSEGPCAVNLLFCDEKLVVVR